MKIKQSQQFDIMVGKIFDRLLTEFPTPIFLDPKDVGILSAKDVEPEETLGGMGVLKDDPPTADKDFFKHCATWLQEEGYISATALRSGGFSDVRLTEKALHVLKIQPNCLSGNLTDV